MVDTCQVVKEPICCAACGSHQYETLLRIARGTPVTCIECRQDIDLPRDNAEIFASTVAFVREEHLRHMGLQTAEIEETHTRRFRSPMRMASFQSFLANTR